MSSKHTIKLVLLVIAIGGTFLVLRSASSSKSTEKADACKEESMEDCSKNRDNGPKMVWENPSAQFFSSF